MINLLSLGTITSNYGNRTAPTQGASTDHKGIDIVLKDSSIPAIVGGEVIASGYNSTAGNYITIKDKNGYTQTYMHMASKSPLAVGSTVKEGDTIGKQGSTGVSTGDHLHFEVKDNSGSYLNPKDFLNGASGTVTGSGASDEVELVWWGDIVKVILSALLILCGVVFLVLGINGDLLGGKLNVLKAI